MERLRHDTSIDASVSELVTTITLSAKIFFDCQNRTVKESIIFLAVLIEHKKMSYIP